MTKITKSKEFCPYCEKLSFVTVVAKPETLNVRGEPVEYEAQVFRCDSCHNEFAPTDLEERNFQSAFHLYRQKYKLLSPEDIKKIRTRYGLSQRAFSRFLGWGEITVHRYEAGAIQSFSHNDTLVLVQDEHNALKLLEVNRVHLSPSIADKLEKRIKELIDRKDEDRGRALLIPWEIETDNRPSIYTGFKVFDLEKLENLILYILEKCGAVGKTRLNKLLWYSDSKHYKEHGISITGSRYIHLQYGPVPHDYDFILWKLQKDNKIESKEVVYHNYTGESFISLSSSEASLFNSDEMKTIKYVLDILGHLNASQISEKSHEEKGYRKTSQKDAIPYEYALELSI